MDKTNDPEADALAQRIQNRAAGRVGRMIGEAQGEVAEKEFLNKLWGGSVSADGFVASVDPSDMKNVFQMGRETQAMAQAAGSTGGHAIGHGTVQSVCSPGANSTAAWYRLKMLGICDAAGLPLTKPVMSTQTSSTVSPRHS